MTVFQDHFSRQAAAYARYRPTYPAELFAYLASVSPRRDRAWDCATGSGQAALGLAPHFREVIATDASDAQIVNAAPDPRVRYMVAASERSGLSARSIDLITVAAALHWLDLDAFYREAKQVSAPGAVIAAWTYDLASVDPAIDAKIRKFSAQTVGQFWPPERRYVDLEYRTIPFPFERLKTPHFSARAEWSLGQLESYVGTWSAVVKAQARTGRDPLAILDGWLAPLWGPAERVRTVSWELFLLVGRVDGTSRRRR
ncbi:MAG: class I SAM-dependent methyltransferase [Gemmatimonadales bacterium]|nr:class I SAM-dependent methyltransferase [Gemmatimonadales bacterium]